MLDWLPGVGAKPKMPKAPSMGWMSPNQGGWQSAKNDRQAGVQTMQNLGTQYGQNAGQARGKAQQFTAQAQGFQGQASGALGRAGGHAQALGGLANDSAFYGKSQKLRTGARGRLNTNLDASARLRERMQNPATLDAQASMRRAEMQSNRAMQQESGNLSIQRQMAQNGMNAQGGQAINALYQQQQANQRAASQDYYGSRNLARNEIMGMGQMEAGMLGQERQGIGQLSASIDGRDRTRQMRLAGLQSAVGAEGQIAQGYGQQANLSSQMAGQQWQNALQYGQMEYGANEGVLQEAVARQNSMEQLYLQQMGINSQYDMAQFQGNVADRNAAMGFWGSVAGAAAGR